MLEVYLRKRRLLKHRYRGLAGLAAIAVVYLLFTHIRLGAWRHHTKKSYTRAGGEEPHSKAKPHRQRSHGLRAVVPKKGGVRLVDDRYGEESVGKFDRQRRMHQSQLTLKPSVSLLIPLSAILLCSDSLVRVG
eukprot:scaffold383288_cov35-Prasinocladus_malaysianus.AAC.1